jgi:hypothetical protein
MEFPDLGQHCAMPACKQLGTQMILVVTLGFILLFDANRFKSVVARLRAHRLFAL